MRVLFFSLILCLSLQLFADNAKVKYMIGDVRVKQSSGQGNWDPLSMQANLQEKDIIRTAAQSLCEIELPGGSISKIMENSILELRDFPSKGGSSTELFTGIGKFYFKVKKLFSGQFQITSPVAVAAIRGTEFIVINQNDKTELLVKSGRIDFSDLEFNTIIQVGAGKKSYLQAGMPPSEPQDLSPADQQLFADAQKEAGSQDKGLEKNDALIEAVGKPSDTDPSQNEDQKKVDANQDTQTGFRTGVSIGAVTIDNQIYNQIGLRPEFSIGKLGVALDLSFYIDKDGNIRDENWNSFRDFFEKIYYVRWGKRGDPFYAKVGAIDNYRLGFGLLMNHYTNTVEYPDVIRTGVEVGLQSDTYGFDGMLNNISELTDGGGLVAGRFSYRLLGNLEIGVSTVMDINQYKGLKDRDDDGVPDYIDPLPDDKEFWRDSDGDGVPDEVDPDRDGDGYTDNTQDPAKPNNQHPDSARLKPEPFNVDKADDKTQFAIALDISYPLLNFDYLRLVAYSQWAKYPHNGSWGVTFPGFMAKFAFVNAFAEYRVFSSGFMPEYFNTTYELERAVFRQVSVNDSTNSIQPLTKRELLNRISDNMKGYVIGADFNILDMLVFGAEYQNMSRGQLKLRTLRSTLDLNTTFIPKIDRAGAYYIQNNAKEIFKRSEGTILGYRLEYRIAQGTSLLFDFRQTFRDLNGDGKISGSAETVKSTNIQTVIRF